MARKFPMLVKPVPGCTYHMTNGSEIKCTGAVGVVGHFEYVDQPGDFFGAFMVADEMLTVQFRIQLFGDCQ